MESEVADYGNQCSIRECALAQTGYLLFMSGNFLTTLLMVLKGLSCANVQ